MIKILLTRGYIAQIDDEDADFLKHTWRTHISDNGVVYAQRNLRPINCSYDGEHDLYQFVVDFKCGDFQFDTCDLPSGRVYCYQFIWCLYAIVWAIQQYDAAVTP